jgi:hypothetical protein
LHDIALVGGSASIVNATAPQWQLPENGIDHSFPRTAYNRSLNVPWRSFATYYRINRQLHAGNKALTDILTKLEQSVGEPLQINMDFGNGLFIDIGGRLGGCLNMMRTVLRAHGFWLAAAYTLFLPWNSFAVAQAVADVRPAAATHLPADTIVEFEITDHINSKTNAIGDVFQIRLVNPIVQNGQAIVPAGTQGTGEIIHVARARAGGKAGELILAVRYLELGGQKIPLHGFRFGKGGQSNVDGGMVLAFAAGPMAYLVVGGEVDVPSGTPGHAKTAGDVELVRPSTGS